MKPSGPRPAEETASRAALVDRLRRLEGELHETQAALAAFGGERLPGLHLLVRAGGRLALLAASRVREVVRLVATQPLAGAPDAVLGTFVCRGAPVVAVDLGAALAGERREPALDAQIVVLGGTPALGLVVERIDGLVDAPLLFDGDADAGTAAAWRGNALVAGLCVHGGDVLPLVDPSPLADAVRERA